AGVEITARLPTCAGMSSMMETALATVPALSVRVIVYRSTSPFTASPPFLSSTVFVDMDRSGGGAATVKVPLPVRYTVPSVPSQAVTVAFHAPIDVVGGTAYVYRNVLVAVAVATCVMLPDASAVPPASEKRMVGIVPPGEVAMSLLPNGSLTTAHRYTVLPTWYGADTGLPV